MGTRYLCALLMCLAFCATAPDAQVLTYEQTIFDSLPSPRLFALSPDGNHVYITKQTSITVLARNATTGKLAFVQELRNFYFDIEGLDSPQSIAISPDGSHVYTGSTTGIVIFARDSLEGTLTQEDHVVGGPDGISALANVTSMDVSPDGEHLYAVSVVSNGNFFVFDRNPITGTLSLLDTIDSAEGSFSGPDTVRVSPDGEHVYVVDPFLDRIDTYDRDPVTGGVTLAGSVSEGVGGVSGINEPQDLALSPDGEHVYVAGKQSSSVTVLDRDPATGLLTFLETNFDGGPDLADGLFFVDSVDVSANGAFVYSASSSDDSVSIFERDLVTGLLTFRAVLLNPLLSDGGLNGVTDISVSPDNTHLYAASPLDNKVTIIGAVPSKGTASLITQHTDFDGFNGANGLAGAARVAASPDGANIYVIGAFESLDAIGIFARSPLTGRLSYVGFANRTTLGITQLDSPRDIVVSPESTHLYVVDNTGSHILVFDRNLSNGLLTFNTVYTNDVGGVTDISRPQRVVISDDGMFLAVVSLDDAGATFLRDPLTGALTFGAPIPVEMVPGLEQVDALQELEFVPGVPQLLTQRQFQTSNYSLNQTNGVLTRIGGTAGIEELDFFNANDTVVSPDARHIYTSKAGNVASLARDESNGAISLIALMDEGLGNVQPFNFSLAISPNGEYLFTPAENATNTTSGVGVYRRDVQDGTIEELELFPNGQDDSDGFLFAKQNVVSPDGANLYVVDSISSALTTFSVGERSSLRGFITSNGNPVPCAVVELTSSNGDLVRTAVTDVNGQYDFASLAIDVYAIRLFGVGVAPSDEGDIDLTGGIQVNRNFAMASATVTGGVAGVVLDDDTNDPLVAARVRAFIGENLVGTTYTCASGQYEISNLVNKGNATIIDLEFSLLNYDTITDQVSVNGGQVTPADQTLTKSLGAIGSLSGFVFGETESDDVALPGAQLIVRGPVNVSAVADGDGSYSFDALLPGDYVIRAASEGYNGESIVRNIPAQGAAIRVFRLELESDNPSDLNNDGAVNAVDIQLVINVVLGNPGGVDGDVDGNGVVNAVDIQLVILAVLGLL